VPRVEESSLWNAGENFVFAVYPVGRTKLIHVKLRDKCKIEKTLFSNFSFFFPKIEKIQVLLDFNGRKREQNCGTNGLKYSFYIDTPDNDPFESCSCVLSSLRNLFGIDCIEVFSLGLSRRIS